MKCKICGKRFALVKDRMYMVIEKPSLDRLFSKSQMVWDAIDCPRCGCQVLVGNRLPPFAPNRADGDE